MPGENRSSRAFECSGKPGNVCSMHQCVLFQRMLLGLDSGKPGFEVGNLMVIRAAEEGH